MFQKRKIAVIGGLAAAVVLIAEFVGFKVYDSQPKSLLDVVQVQFSGYDESEHWTTIVMKLQLSFSRNSL